MPKLIMTKGLPASGKSTWAKEQCDKYGWKRINKDDLRSMLDNGKWSRKNEEFVLWIRDLVVLEALGRNYNIIVDDTNLAKKHESKLRELADVSNADFVIQDFTDVPLNVCLDRDRNRPNAVGEKVIMAMNDEFLKKKVDKPKYLNNKPEAIICDLDGTLCLFGDNNPYDRDFYKDEINFPVASVVRICHGRDIQIIFTSGRSEKFRDVTEKWITDFMAIGENYKLLMRKDGDSRKDSVVKKEIYQAEIKGNYNILFVLDDRNQVVDMWRDQGLTTFQVAPGDF